MDEEIVKQLEQSRAVMGEVNAVIIDYDGEVLSGRHRKQAGWEKTEKVDTRELAEKWKVSPLMAKDMVRLHLNIQRKPSKEETQFLLRRMALCLKDQGIEEEKVASELAKKVPYSHQYILQLLPDKYKQKEKAVSPGRPVSVKLVKQISMSLVECERCHMATREATEHKGSLLCPRCLELATYKPEKQQPVDEVKPKVTMTIQKPKDKWEHRKAVMTPQTSKMEEAVLLALEEKDVHPEIGREFCLQSTTPDYYFPQQNLAVYLDGPVHAGREDRDEALRELLTRRYGVQVLSLTYTAYTETEKQEIVKQIAEAIQQRT